jgi:hypothetical protein
MHSPTSHFLHFSCLSISSSSKRHFIATVWWNENYDIQSHYVLTENWIHSVSQLQCKRFVVTIERAIFLAAAMEGLRTDVWTSLSWILIHSLFYPSSQQIRITGKCSKNVNLTNRIIRLRF